MKAYFSVILIFVVLFMLYLPVAYLKYTREADAEFSALLLSKAVDYAGEAAMSACIEVADLEAEYAEGDYLVMSPDKAAYTFASVLCLSYDIPQTNRNIAYVKDKIPVMVLATNDGYHIAEKQETDNGEEALMWKLKRPYTVDLNPNSNTGDIYGVELGMRKWRSVDKQSLAISEGNQYSILPFSKETMLQQINRAINRDVTAVLRRYAISNNKQHMQSFYLPISANTVGVRRFEKPGLLAVMQDIDLDGIRPQNLSVINGMSVSQRCMVVGWTDGAGRKWYCYQGQADSASQSWIELNGEMFVSIEEASKAGYLPDN